MALVIDFKTTSTKLSQNQKYAAVLSKGQMEASKQRVVKQVPG